MGDRHCTNKLGFVRRTSTGCSLGGHSADTAAPDAAAVEPAAPALPLAPAVELCAKVGAVNEKTNVIVAKIFKIRIKLTPTNC